MNQDKLRGYAKPAGFVAAGLLAGIVMAGTVSANAAEDGTGSTDGTTTGTPGTTESRSGGAKPPCPDEKRGEARSGGSAATTPSPAAVPSSFQFA